MSSEVICGDNVQVLRGMPPNTFDACITDPPYGMGMDNWDKNVPPASIWAAVKHVLKPGAFLLSFCSPQMYHRMAVNVEDAGFLPMDMVMWMVTTKMVKKNRLKPTHEPILVAQNPLDGSINHNFETWGCGKIETGETRIPWEKEPPTGWVANSLQRRVFGGAGNTKGGGAENGTVDADLRGRYPANIVGIFDNPDHQKYFYAPRVTRKERGEGNNHPTPKPIDLMAWLIRVYAPKGGKILDPFCGSGSTLIAAEQEKRESLGIDNNPDYCVIARRRLDASIVRPVAARKPAPPPATRCSRPTPPPASLRIPRR